MAAVSEYLEKLNTYELGEYQRVKNAVLEVEPHAEEMMSYGLPTFKLNGKPLLHFGAFKDHLSIFPTGDPMPEIAEEVAVFRTAKGTLQYTEARPIPSDLIKKIVRARRGEIEKK